MLNTLAIVSTYFTVFFRFLVSIKKKKKKRKRSPFFGVLSSKHRLTNRKVAHATLTSNIDQLAITILSDTLQHAFTVLYNKYHSGPLPIMFRLIVRRKSEKSHQQGCKKKVREKALNNIEIWGGREAEMPSQCVNIRYESRLTAFSRAPQARVNIV